MILKKIKKKGFIKTKTILKKINKTLLKKIEK